MDTSKDIIAQVSANKKGFIGVLLAAAGVIFLLAGVMFFIALLSAIWFKLDLLTCFIIGSLVTGIVASSISSVLLPRSSKPTV